MRYLTLTALVLLFSPQVLLASVIINEVAWMGSLENPNAEWIELFNSASGSVALDGWTLSAEDGTPHIILDGKSISANGYLLLRRGAEGDYTGALGNEGEILVLKDATGAEIDRVDGSDSWAIGGSNETKDTLSLISGSFTTAKPTPCKANVSAQTSPPATEPEPEQTQSSNKKDDTTDASEPDDDEVEAVTPNLNFHRPRLSVSAGGNRTVTVGTASTFSARAFEDDGDESLL
jgi:hypothetical protein